MYAGAYFPTLTSAVHCMLFLRTIPYRQIVRETRSGDVHSYDTVFSHAQKRASNLLRTMLLAQSFLLEISYFYP